MPCIPIDGGHVCVRDRQPRKPCYLCGKRAGFLCDFELSVDTAGNSKTCDRPICGKCRHSIGPEKDLCPEHYFYGPRQLALPISTTKPNKGG